MTNKSAINQLRQVYAWPDQQPDLKPIPWALDVGGRHLVTEQIQSKKLKVILEIGVFLGGSARKWLEASPDVIVLALDAWQPRPGLARFARSHGQPDWVADQLAADQEALYNTFLSTMWEFRDRIVPIRAWSPDALYEIANFGIQPDLIYIDADKSGREIKICHELFPAAILSGDDWFCGTDRFWRPDDGYRIRKPVKDFCRREGKHLTVDNHTWVIGDEAPNYKQLLSTTSYQMKSLRRRVRGAYRWLLKKDRAA